MHVAIDDFFHINREMWARVYKKEKHGNTRTAFTHLMAIMMVIYQVDIWHNRTDDKEYLLKIAKLITIRWRSVLRRDDSNLGQNADGRRGIEMFMKQIESNWSESKSNYFLQNKFQFFWR